MQAERIVYENDNGESVEIAYAFPYFFQGIEGHDGASASITKITGMGQDGSTITNVVLQDREITVKGIIKGDTKDEIETYRRKLLKVFNPKVKGWLQYEYGSLSRIIRCQPETGSSFAKETKSFRVQNFLVNLLCPNPYWQDLNAVKSDIAVWREAFEFPLEITEDGIEIGFREPSLIVNINNAGDVACGVKIQFRALATVINPGLININNREQFKIIKTMDAGEIITATTHFRNKKVTLDKNGVTSNAFNYIDRANVFLQLEPGDNLFRYDAEDGIDNLEVNIWHTPQYLGV